MASVSVSHMIIFIASILVAASVVGTFTEEVSRLSSAIGDQGLDVSQDVRTDIKIISDAGSEVYDRDGNGNITLLVKNTGSRALPPDPEAVDVLVDGQYETAVTLSVKNGGGDDWGIGEVVSLEISPSTTFGTDEDHRVKLIVDSDEEVFEFRT